MAIILKERTKIDILSKAIMADSILSIEYSTTPDRLVNTIYNPQDKKNIITNGNIFNVCAILKFDVCSAAEAELDALFINAKAGKIVCLIL